MIPTFFAISFVIFVILNLAPGKPGGELLGSEGESSEGGSKRQAYLIFKQQFNLDKPIMFNMRFALSTKEIETYLTQILNEDKKVPSKYIIKAQDTIEDYGTYAVPHLVKIISENQNEKIKRLAVLYLSQNAQGRLINTYSDKPDKALQDMNRKIDSENFYLRSLVYSADASKEEKEKVIGEWQKWYDKNRGRFEYSFLSKVYIFFFDTRFAKYWWNLVHLDFGISHVDKQSVIKKILSKIKYSLSLSVSSVIIAYIISIPLGIFSAVKQHSTYDRIVTLHLWNEFAHLPLIF